uniref:Nicotinamide riboside transporter PnuC n=1 Tax=Magnetococcus massalia (strain MO-1) TaxID=451514 RepID=A0A1S7LFV4_MAGMO|nr:conserved protein of unknown function [Candidatus Magnetococcus massalia]
MTRLDLYKWVGTITGISAALLMALNIPISRYAFFLYLTSSISWGIASIQMRDKPLLYLQIAFLLVNVVGIYRWFIAV